MDQELEDILFFVIGDIYYDLIEEASKRKYSVCSYSGEASIIKSRIMANTLTSKNTDLIQLISKEIEYALGFEPILVSTLVLRFFIENKFIINYKAVKDHRRLYGPYLNRRVNGGKKIKFH